MTHTNPEFQTSVPLIPPEITAHADSFVLSPADDNHDKTHVVELQLKYGEQSLSTALEVMSSETNKAAENYLSGAQDFLAFGPESPLPSIAKRPTYEYGRWGDQEEVTKQIHCAADLQRWASLTKKYNPQLAHDIANSMAQAVTSFDAARFNAGLQQFPETYDGRNQKDAVNGAARHVLFTAASNVSSCALDSQPLHEILTSDMAKTFFGADDRIALKAEIVRREGGFTGDDEKTPFFLELQEEYVAFIKAQDGEHFPLGLPGKTGRIVEVIANEDPRFIMELCEQFPHAAYELRKASAAVFLDKEKNGGILDQQDAALMDYCERSFMADADHYATYLSARADATGTVSQDRTAHMAKLLRREAPTKRGSDKIARLVLGNVPDHDFEAVFAANPWLETGSFEQKALLIRRAARAGSDPAALVRWAQENEKYSDSNRSTVEPIKNLYAIYEETGYEPALATAKAREDAYLNGRFVYGLDLYTINAHRHRAAETHGDEHVMSETFADMEVMFDSENTYDRGRSLAYALQYYLDQGDISAAEHYALELFYDKQPDNKSDHDKGPDALGHIVYHYQKNGQQEDALRILREHVFPANTDGNNWRLNEIIKASFGNKNALWPLYATSVDETRRVAVERFN